MSPMGVAFISIVNTWGGREDGWMGWPTKGWLASHLGWPMVGKGWPMVGKGWEGVADGWQGVAETLSWYLKPTHHPSMVCLEYIVA